MSAAFHYQKARVERLRKLMADNGIGMFLIPPGPNFFYFTGFETESMERLTLLVVTQESISTLNPKLMEEQLEKRSWIEDTKSWLDSENPYRLARTLVSRASPSLVAIDGTLPYFHYSNIFDRLRVKKMLGDRLLSSLRVSKDPEEIESISVAIKRSESALRDTLDFISDEVTERQVADRLEENMKKHGIEKIAFSTIIASGENSSIPHHEPTSRKLSRYEPIVIDFGGRHNGYASDTSRTFFIDKATPDMEEIYEVVRSSQETTSLELNEESTYADADRIARSVFEKRGYGPRFVIRLGHGLGISVHEEPYLVAENKSQMIENSVFTIEPGIYIPNKGGMRIEDTVYFSQGKCIPFNSFSKEIGYL